jgi:hypothetical protein
MPSAADREEHAAIAGEVDGFDDIRRPGASHDDGGTAINQAVLKPSRLATVELPDGFIWTRGQCGQGTFHAKAGALNLAFEKTNWILQDFDWSNTKAGSAAA